MQDVIRRHAQLSCAIKHHVSNNRPVPSHLTNELQRLESKAAATLTVQQQQSAMRASQALQAQMFHQRDVQAAQRQAKDKEFFLNHAAKQGTGYDLAQLQQIKQTGKVTERPKFYAGRARERVTALAKRLNPNLSLKQWEDIAERFQEMRDLDKDPSAYLKSKFGDRAAEAAGALQAFNDSGIEFAYKLSKDEDVTHELSQDERQNLDLRAEAAMQNPEAWNDPIDPSYTDPENDTLQGDVARAMEKLEFEQMAEERESYV